MPRSLRSTLSLAAALAALSAIPVGAMIRSVPSLDYPTIQSAIDASSSGDTVAVYSGVYAESLTLSGKDLALLGVPADDTPVLVTTNHTARVLTLGSGVTSATVISDLELSDGNAPRGGAVVIPSGASPLFRRCRFSNNVAHEVGGSSLGGALYFDVGSGGVIEDCAFSYNSARAPIQEKGFASGGAIHCADQSQITVRRSYFLQNFAQGFEGGPGGAIMLVQANGVIGACTFERNGGGEGGAIASVRAGLSVQDCMFRSNTTGYGAVVYWDGSAYGTLRLRGNVFVDNTPAIGPTVFASGLLPSEIASNTIAFNQGGLAGLEINGNFTVSQNIVSNNQGGGIDCHGTGTLSCNDVWSNGSAYYGSGCADPTGTNGNISADPVFCDAANRDLRLQESSPCAPAHNACGLVGALPVGCTVNSVGAQPAPGIAFLAPIAPNPPRGPIRFRIEVARPARLKLVILDAAGRSRATVADDWFEPGRHERTWSGAQVQAPGVYWALLQGPGIRQSRRFLIVR